MRKRLPKLILLVLITGLLAGTAAHAALTQTIVNSWDNGSWVNSSRSTYTYSPNQTVLTMSMWVNNDWIEYLRMTTTLDNNGNATQIVTENNFGTWVVASTIVMTTTYDGNGNPLETIEVMNGVNSTKTINTYTNGNITSILIQFWNGSGWDDDTRITTTYSGGVRTQVMLEMMVNGSWQDLSRSAFTYSGGKLMETVTEEWDNGAWVNLSRTTNTYNGSQVAEELHEDWSGSAWVNSTKWVHTYDGTTGVEELGSVLPEEFGLSNYPNPFNPETAIHFQLPSNTAITLAIYDSRGRLVKTLAQDQPLAAGGHTLIWDGRDQQGHTVPSGMYIYTLRSAAFSATKRCTLLK